MTATLPESGLDFLALAWDVVAKDFEDPPEQPEYLRDPVSLACYLEPHLYVRRPHLEVIAETYRDVDAGKVDRVGISLPPQVGKSSTAVVWGVFWWLILHKTHSVILVSYADSLAVKHGRAVRRLVEAYGAEFGLYLDASHRAANDWSLTTGGGMRSVGIHAGITGHPGDLGIIDDPHKNRIEANSKTVRDAVHAAYSADIQSRLAPGAPVIGVQTRWDPDDFLGHRVKEEGDERDGGRWRILNMQAICTDPERDPLSRAYGEPLPHPKIPLEDKAAALRHWEDKRRSASAHDWGALWQGDPQPLKGTLITADELIGQRWYVRDDAGRLRTMPEVKKSAVAVDPSGGGRDTAGIVGGHLGVDNRLYITHDRTDVMPSDRWSREACLLAHEIDAERIVVENNFGADMAKLVVRTAWESLCNEGAFGHDEDGEPLRPLPPEIRMVHAKKGKLLRAEPIAQQWREDNIRSGAPVPDVEAEWVTWQPDSTDSPGRIDASVYLAYDLLPVPGSSGVISSAAKVSRSAVGGGARGRSQSVTGRRRTA